MPTDATSKPEFSALRAGDGGTKVDVAPWGSSASWATAYDRASACACSCVFASALTSTSIRPRRNRTKICCGELKGIDADALGNSSSPLSEASAKFSDDSRAPTEVAANSSNG